jgi:hypothetical protein
MHDSKGLLILMQQELEEARRDNKRLYTVIDLKDQRIAFLDNQVRTCQKLLHDFRRLHLGKEEHNGSEY